MQGGFDGANLELRGMAVETVLLYIAFKNSTLFPEEKSWGRSEGRGSSLGSQGTSARQIGIIRRNVIIHLPQQGITREDDNDDAKGMDSWDVSSCWSKRGSK